MIAKAVEAKLYSGHVLWREGLEKGTFVEKLTGLITGTNNSSGGALFVTVAK